MKSNKPLCRMKVLVLSLLVATAGVTYAEATTPHPEQDCGEAPHCVLTVIKSFCTALSEDSGGVSWRVSH